MTISLTGALAQSASVGTEYFERSIKPIFESRCIQCHSCYNSPCQLNLGSAEGLDRGLVKGFDVFTPGKLKSAEPSRLGIDRKTTEGWRNFSKSIHFMPVTQSTGNPQTNRDASFILKLVEHKQANASLAVDDLQNPKQNAEVSRMCPETPKDLATHLASRPNAGMPYGLPPLSETQIQKIREWTEMGSPRSATPRPLSQDDVPRIREIESFLNAYKFNSDTPSAKKQFLVSRFIYEHLFLAHIYFRNENAPQSFYSLIRSSSPCQNPNEIATRRPWDDTKSPFHYCLKRVDAMLVHKTHLPYLIDAKKLQRWQRLFFSTQWQVTFTGKPGSVDVAPRDDYHASNPFEIYKDIPVKAKYQFLLDDANFHVASFTKGPVCKGSTAVNSIDEQFYVLFLKPDSDLMVRNPDFNQRATYLTLLPANKGSDQTLGLGVALRERNTRNAFRQVRNGFYAKEFPKGYSVQDIWNGQDDPNSTDPATANHNAALTVFRHEDSAIVEKGFIGATSKTVFVLDYSIFERIYYNLVAGFDVFGDASHQLHTRLYMSYTKMEAEENFLSFLPSSVRIPMRRSWYLKSNNLLEDIDGASSDIIAGSFPLLGLDRDNLNSFQALDQSRYDKSSVIQKLSVLREYRRRLISLFKARLGPALANNNTLNYDKPLLSKSSEVTISEVRDIPEFERELSKLSDLPGLNSKWVLKMPSSSLLVVESPEGPELYTIVRNKEHLNIAWLSHEHNRRNEAADTIVFYKGVLTSYPNFIFHIDVRRGREFLEEMKNLTDHNSYEIWTRRFGSPRSGPGSEKFWPSSDRVHQVFQAMYPVDYGALDYNRYGTDYRYKNDDKVDFINNLPKGLRLQLKEELNR
jgi:hypothetical protein